MSATLNRRLTATGIATGLLRAIVVGLTLATAGIHATLGGPLFALNSIGYSVFATMMAVPGPIGRVRWLVRLGLLGFTATTIVGWVMFGARFDLAYLDKGIEAAHVAALLIELWFVDGGPFGIAREARRLLAEATGSFGAAGHAH